MSSPLRARVPKNLDSFDRSGPHTSAKERRGTSVGTDPTAFSPRSFIARSRYLCAANEKNTRVTDSNSVFVFVWLVLKSTD